MLFITTEKLRNQDTAFLDSRNRTCEKVKNFAFKVLQPYYVLPAALGVVFLPALLGVGPLVAISAALACAVPGVASVAATILANAEQRRIQEIKTDRILHGEKPEPAEPPAPVAALPDIGKEFHQGIEKCVTVKTIKLKTAPPPEQPLVW